MDYRIFLLFSLALAQNVAGQERATIRSQSRQAIQRSATGPRAVFPANPDVVPEKRAVLSRVPVVTGREKRPPNIVLIFADDLGYADTGIYGSADIPTPNIDAIGKQGVKFTNAYVTAASCSPSRAGLMTGRYQQRFGFEFNTSGGAVTHREHRGLDPRAIAIADVLKKAGYVTGMFGKWHLGTQPQFHPQARGFDEFYGFLAGAHSFLPVKRPEQVFSTVMRSNEPLKESEYLTDAIARLRSVDRPSVDRHGVDRHSVDRHGGEAVVLDGLWGASRARGSRPPLFICVSLVGGLKDEITEASPSGRCPHLIAP
ncbi:MAG: sulfatase-like hydrolase/transferase [Planctomycetes bacterium]|nr:sulfatase-like hydrolase/transferase [Planctomycetota bacterium]